MVDENGPQYGDGDDMVTVMVMVMMMVMMLVMVLAMMLVMIWCRPNMVMETVACSIQITDQVG